MKVYLELLQTLIRKQPVTAQIENVNAVTEILREFLAEHKCHTVVEELDGRKILYASNCGSDIPDVLLNAHVDVVPAEPADFEPYIKDGRLYGRGSADCLGNAISATRAVIEAPAGVKLAVVFSSDEEVGGKTTAAMVERGYTAKHAILVLDNSENNIIYSQKGILTARLTAEGKSGHAAYPWYCDNPVEKLMYGYTKFRDQWVNPVNEDDWRSSLAPCILKAGDANNRIPEKAEMVLNFRFVRDNEQEDILKALRDITGCEATPIEVMQPVAFSADIPEFKLISTIMEAHDKTRKYPLQRLCGATDARHWKLTGRPVAVAGAIGENIHSQNECVEIDALKNLADAVTEFAEVEASR